MILLQNVLRILTLRSKLCIMFNLSWTQIGATFGCYFLKANNLLWNIPVFAAGRSLSPTAAAFRISWTGSWVTKPTVTKQMWNMQIALRLIRLSLSSSPSSGVMWQKKYPTTLLLPAIISVVNCKWGGRKMVIYSNLCLTFIWSQKFAEPQLLSVPSV